MYSGLVKAGTANMQDEQLKMIDTNELVERRIAELAEKMRRSAGNGAGGGAEGSFEDGAQDGFVAGISAEQVEGLLSDEEDGQETAAGSNVIKGKAEAAALVEKAKEEAQELLEQARSDADRIRDEMRSLLEQEREEALAHAREQGYQEGMQRAEQFLQEEQKKLEADRQRTEEEYQRLVQSLEPQFIDAITGIYEHIFAVELSSYREILVHLIASTIHRIEGSKSFLVHVSKEDHSYVSMHKKQIAANMMAANGELEIVEDITLKPNECLIETDGGIFDCGLGTQLSELSQKLRLLSYEKS